MILRNLLRQFAVAAGASLVGLATLSATASAQNWDWGGGKTVGGGGRQSVRFSPSFKTGEVVVSFGDRRLYHIVSPGEAHSYPIAVPREQSRWQGVMSITQKRINPSWTPTPTMIAENPKLPSWVPGGHPLNPLGVRGLYLGSSAYRIHGTDAPWTIGQPVSKGCIRMYNQDVIELYDRVSVGTKVTVTWQQFQGGAPGEPVASNSDSGKRPVERRTSQSRTQYRALQRVALPAQ